MQTCGLSAAIALQSEDFHNPTEAIAIFNPLSTLLAAVEWQGRSLRFNFRYFDHAAFDEATAQVDQAVPSSSHPWGYAEWWLWDSQGPFNDPCPRWWKDPPDWVVSATFA